MLTGSDYLKKFIGENKGAFPNKYWRQKKTQNKVTNDITCSIIRVIVLSGGVAFRVNTSGIPFIVGGKPLTKNGKLIYRKSKNKGAADIRCIYRGASIDIEIKSDKDKLSKDQQAFRDKVIAAGGRYWEVRSMDEFYTLWNSFLKTIKY